MDDQTISHQMKLETNFSGSFKRVERDEESHSRRAATHGLAGSKHC